MTDAKEGEDLRLLSSWLVYARETSVEEFRDGKTRWVPVPARYVDTGGDA
jgi:hypothetical protein